MKRRILIRTLPLLLAGLLLSGCETHTHAYTQTVIPPTCSSIGYTMHVCACGDHYFSDYQAESAHSFGEWIAGKEATLTVGGEEYRICKNCGDLETRDVENLSALAKVYLESDGTLLYSAGGLRFTCGQKLTALTEGSKPAYDLVLTAANDENASYSVDLGWGEQSRYRLEPCFPDPTLSRASAAEEVWLACLALREQTAWASEIQSGSFPVQIYFDDVYFGLYRLTPPEDSWKYAYDGSHGSPTAAIRAEDDSAGCLFEALPSYTAEKSDFTVIHCSTEEVSWATESFDGFSIFVRDSKNAAFKEQLSQYTDPTALIDFFLLCNLFGLSTGDTAGTVWTTADGIRWLPSFSSLAALSTAYGLTTEGKVYTEASAIPTPAEDGSVAYGGENLLWTRLCSVFAEEIRARYAVLRDAVLKPELLYGDFLEQYERIEFDLYATDQELHPSLPDDGYEIAVVLTFLQNRCEAMDEWLAFES